MEAIIPAADIPEAVTDSDMRYKAAIFDMDGTILNTLEDLTDSVNHTMKKHGLPTHDIDKVRFMVGNGIPTLISRAVPEGTSPEEEKEVLRSFMEYYTLHSADKTKPYPGISDLLKRLQAAGVKTAVVSNKADIAVQGLVEQYFDGLFDAAAGDREGVERKPAPDLVNLVLKQLGVRPEEAVYIGDSDVDVATAKNAGLGGVFVDFGFRSREFLIEHGALEQGVIVSSASEAGDVILAS